MLNVNRQEKWMERRIAGAAAKEKELSPEEEYVYEEYTRNFNKRAPSILDFRSEPDYSNQEIIEDSESLEKEKIRIGAKETHAKSQIVESLVACGIEKFRWLGREVKLTNTSEYDDFFNGIDIAVEIPLENEPEPLRLAIDVTTASNPETLRKEVENKLNRIFRPLENGKLGEIKYFASPSTKEKFRLKSVPTVVVGAKKESFMKLAEHLYNLDHLPSSTKLSRLRTQRNEINYSPIAVRILDEIIIQLTKQRNMLGKLERSSRPVRIKNRQNYRESKKIIEKTLETLKDIEDQRIKTAQIDKKNLGLDAVQQAINEFQPRFLI